MCKYGKGLCIETADFPYLCNRWNICCSQRRIEARDRDRDILIDGIPAGNMPAESNQVRIIAADILGHTEQAEWRDGDIGFIENAITVQIVVPDRKAVAIESGNS